MSLPIGGTVPGQRGESNAWVIQAVEQVIGGDTLIAFSNAAVNRFGEARHFQLTKTVRLTAAEREHLIRLLSDHRFADLAASLRTEPQS